MIIVKNIDTLYDMYVYINMQIGIHQTHARGGAYMASTWFSVLCLFSKCVATCFSSLASGVFKSSPPNGASMIGQPSGIGTRKETVLDSAEAWIGGQKSQQQILLQDTGSLGVFQKENGSDYQCFMLMDISRLPCKENLPMTPLYRTPYRGDESHNESCLYYQNKYRKS